MDAKKNPSADIHRFRPLFLSASLVISLAIVIMAFEWKLPMANHQHDRLVDSRWTEEILDIPPTDITPPLPVRIRPVKTTEVKDEAEAPEEVQITFDPDMASEPESIESSGVEVPVEVADPGDEIFLIVEVPPVFTGGDEALKKFVFKNLKYPNQARRMAIEGRVFVQCVIEKDGSITNVRCIKGIGGGCDEEAVRVISLMPKWNPGKQRGHPVRVNMVFPIVFRI